MRAFVLAVGVGAGVAAGTSRVTAQTPTQASTPVPAQQDTISLPRDSMPRATRVLEELVVTAARREQRLADATVTTELIDRAAIETSGAADLASVLTEQAGILFQEGHPSGAGIMLQGLSSERVLVLIDGQPLYGRISGNIDLARLPTSIVDRVEVVKGPQSTLYGSEAMGGVVNIRTRQAPLGSWGGAGHFTAGSVGRRDGGITAGIGGQTAGILADVGLRSIDRAPGQAGTAGNLAQRADGALKARWMPTPTLALEAGGLVINERQRWLGGSVYSFADNTQVSGRLNASWIRGEHRLSPTLYVSHLNHLSRQSSLPSPIANTGDRQRQSLVKLDFLYSGRLLGHIADAGVEMKQEHITSSDGRIEPGKGTLYSVEPFVQYEVTSARWSILPGARVTWNEQWGAAVTPRIAARYRAASTLSLRASVGRGFRAPDFKELYLQFTNDAAGYAVYGNHDLRPEHSTNVTAGLEWTKRRTFARAQVFWNDLQDFIETRPMPSSGSTTLYTYGNVDNGRTAGTELSAGVTMGQLRLTTAYSYLNTRDGATGKPLLGRPEHAAQVSAGYAVTRGPRVTVTGIYTGVTPMQRDETGTVTSEREAFARMDVHAAQAMPGGFDLTFGIDNAFDTRPARWADAVDRRVYAGVSWVFNRPFHP